YYPLLLLLLHPSPKSLIIMFNTGRGQGQLCMPPLTKPGTCPSPKPFKFCYSHCHYDRDCEGDLKCCPNSCGHTCEPPVTGKTPWPLCLCSLL
uniref:WAP domain-containing protein n=1 Tax=Periophthalmus magnuspinnatus TaxID=409849 RepID=A0A3B3Z9Q8_9GOBI